MTDPPSSTMAPSEAAAPSTANATARTPSHNPPAQRATKSLVTREYDLTIRAFFPTPTAPTKLNPITAMKQLFKTMIKDEPSLVIRSPRNDKQIVLDTASLPSGENEFKKFFKVSTTHNEKHNKTHVCIRCNVLSNRTLSQIKFRSTDSHLLDWLKKERVFVESDSLGIERPITVGYFTKIAPDITNLANLREHLVNQLLLVEIAAETAIELAPHLKDAQLDAMTNGDDYIPILPNFEIYRTRLSHGREPTQVTTDVIGVKCEPRDAKLLGEFFTRMASKTNNDHRDGTFIPKGAPHLLGPKLYEQVIQDNNFFLSNVATIPVNLKYEAWFAVIDPHNNSGNDPISLYEHLLRKPWFLRIESIGRTKCLLVTTRPNLPTARSWIDENLETLVLKSIPPGIDPPASSLPCRLDKPVYTAASKTYADILKQQFSLAPTPQTSTTDNNRPPKKCQASILDYDSDKSTDYPPLATPTATNLSSNNNNQQTLPMPKPTPYPDYATEFLSIKTELSNLKQIIAQAVKQITTAIKSIQINASTSQSTAMETDEALTNTTENSNEQSNPSYTQSDIQTIISELKSDIATITNETRAMFKQLLQPTSTTTKDYASAT